MSNCTPETARTWPSKVWQHFPVRGSQTRMQESLLPLTIISWSNCSRRTALSWPVNVCTHCAVCMSHMRMVRSLAPLRRTGLVGSVRSKHATRTNRECPHSVSLHILADASHILIVQSMPADTIFVESIMTDIAPPGWMLLGPDPAMLSKSNVSGSSGRPMCVHTTRPSSSPNARRSPSMKKHTGSGMSSSLAATYCTICSVCVRVRQLRSVRALRTNASLGDVRAGCRSSHWSPVGYPTLKCRLLHSSVEHWNPSTPSLLGWQSRTASSWSNVGLRAGPMVSMSSSRTTSRWLPPKLWNSEGGASSTLRVRRKRQSPAPPGEHSRSHAETAECSCGSRTKRPCGWMTSSTHGGRG
mmetsp:Transcript_8329/g.20996  ORF Transcript_8329/g.20996 Transcript_8329/m.20996 type:complete len:356 (+) Transcript_8329:891-1958(+)